MNNIEKYSFSDFTLPNYGNLLSLAKDQGFTFSKFTDSFSDKGKRYLIWRHDVEFSPFVAHKMAKMEADRGIFSTYFFQLHGETYNVLEKEVSKLVLEIKEMGHEIGLHFDSHYFEITTEEELDKYLSIDIAYFNKIFGFDIKAFSFHNTNPFILSCENEQYGGILNVYSGFFKKNFNYCADSTGFWRYERLENVLKSKDILKLQVLIHDAMWSEDVLSPRERVFRAIDDDATRIKKWYDKTLKSFGAKNVDWDNIY